MRGQIEPVFLAEVSELPLILPGILQPDDVVLTLGAGNIGAVAQELPKTLKASLEKG
jgi:UDP-N-acetylmuramate--alanine ligase